MRPRFFGWWVVAGGATLAGLNGLVYTFGFSAFFLSFEDAFDVSKARVASIIGFGGLLAGGPMAPLVGYGVDRYGPRKVAIFGVVLLGTGFVLIGNATSFTQLFVFYLVFVALGIGLGTLAPSYGAAANWFSKKRGRAFAVINTGFGIGSMLVFCIAILVQMLGWRDAAFVLGIFVWVVGFAAATLLRHKPEQYGHSPDGVDELRDVLVEVSSLDQRDYTVKQALASKSFWMLFLALIPRIGVFTGVAAHFIPAMTDKAYSETEAAVLLTVFGLVSLPSRLFFGMLSDKVNKRVLLSLSGAMAGLAMLTYVWAGSHWQILIFITLFAVSQGALGPVMMALTADFFGRTNFATIFGFGSMIMWIGTFLAPIIAGALWDYSGSYNGTMYLFAALSAVAALTLLVTPSPTRRGSARLAES